jgi:hypothetical protein
MRPLDENGLLSMVREHNRLNGHWFVVAEFLLVDLAAVLILVSGALHHRAPVIFAGIGIASNSSTVIAIAISQIRGGEGSEGLLKLRSASFRAEISRRNPNLSTHSLIILMAVLIPFLLVTLLLLQGHDNRPKV